MRLIDADELLHDIEKYHLSDGKFQHWVEVQNTVDAIPIEWLKEWFKKRYKGRTYRDLIEEWESEQFWEKEHEIDRC